MDVFIQGRDEGEEIEEEEGELQIEGEPEIENRTIFVEKIEKGFGKYIKNILALTSSFKWTKILEWKRNEENFMHEDQELQVLVTAEGALRQIFERNYKVK